VAFLPGSQVDVRPVRDVGPLMGMPQPFQILKMDRRRGNIVVSRRAVLEESRAEQRAEIVARSRKATSSTAWSRTSPTTARSWISAASTACCTSPTWPGGASTTQSEIVNIGETVKVQVVKHQQGHAAHQPRHEAASGRSVGTASRPSTRSA
jgi:small subunit ribosomal protein S1